MVAESWFRSLWKTSRKHEVGPEKLLVEVLAFEVASLMSKLVHLWQSLSDKQVVKLREEIKNSLGIKKLVSDDDEYIVGLICAEIIENLGHVARAVVRLANKCSDPLLKGFQFAFADLIKVGADPYGWLYTWKKMDRKAKKMEKFIVLNANLYQEMETLAELEQTLRRMKGNDDVDRVSLVEFEKKVAWKRQEVRRLEEISLWNKSYDYNVLLLARSLFTIFSRIGHVFGINHVVDVESRDSKIVDSDYIHRSRSVSVLMQSSVHPSENNIARFSTGPMQKLITQSGPISRINNAVNFHSGPLGNSIATASPNSRGQNFYSGPLAKPTGNYPREKKIGLRLWRARDKFSTLLGKIQFATPNRPGNKCNININGSYSGILNEATSATLEISAHSNSNSVDESIFKFNRRLLNAPPATLGAAALSLHYANVIIVIEKLVASPHLIGQDAREDLYNMLPTSIRAALRARLKPYSKCLSSSVYDTLLVGEWTEAMAGILEWLAPLAHNTIRWQSERSFEHQNLVSRTNVLLVQTLYFANQEKTESTITELLVGLNYVWRFGREVNSKALQDCANTCDDSLCFDE